MALKKRTPKEIIDQFGEIMGMNVDDCTATVCLGSLSPNAEEPRIEQIQITDDLTKEFVDAAKRAIKKYSRMGDKGDLDLRLYDAGSKPDSHEVEFLDLTEYETVRKQVESLA